MFLHISHNRGNRCTYVESVFSLAGWSFIIQYLGNFALVFQNTIRVLGLGTEDIASTYMYMYMCSDCVHQLKCACTETLVTEYVTLVTISITSEHLYLSRIS